MMKKARILIAFVIWKTTGLQTRTAKEQIAKAKRRRELDRQQRRREIEDMQRLLDEEHERRFGWTAAKLREASV